MSARYFASAFKVEVNGASLAADLSKNIVEVSVTHELGTTDQCGLTLANPFPKLPWTHTSDADLFKEGNALKIQMGYVDDLQPMFDGEITSISPAFPGSGTPTVRIEGHSRLHRLQGSRNTRTFQDATDKDVVEQIATDMGLTASVEDTQDVRTKHAYLIQYNQSDLDFLKERAQYIHYEVVMEGKTLVFRKAKEDQSKVYTLVWGGPSKSFDPKKSVMPLNEFNPTLNTLNQVSEVIVRGHDPMSKKEIVGRAGPGSSSMGGTQTGAQVAASAFGGRREEVCVDGPISTQEEADQRARAICSERALQLVTGNGSTIGLPDLRAGSVIELEGLGPRFSGLYYISQATHTIGSGGYLTTFSVKRNAVS
jgi:phage protein D